MVLDFHRDPVLFKKTRQSTRSSRHSNIMHFTLQEQIEKVLNIHKLVTIMDRYSNLFPKAIDYNLLKYIWTIAYL